MRYLLLLAYLTTLQSSDSFAASPNLLACTSTDFFLSGCSLAENKLAVKPIWDAITDEATYTLSYDFTCGPGTGPDTTSIAITSVTAQTILRFGEISSASVTGTGDLALLDLAPRKTKFLLFKKSCHLVLTSEPTVRPSDEQFKKWKNELDQKKLELTDASQSKQGYDDLLRYYGAFYFIKSLATTLNEDLTNDQMNSLRMNASSNNQLLNSMIKNSSKLNLSSSEVLSLANLKVALSSLDEPSKWKNADGSNKSLAEQLSPDDLNILKSLGDEANALKEDEYKTSQNHFATVEAALSARISTLTALIGAAK